MRFTVFHCHNPVCGHRVWVPQDKLGRRGRCPECGCIMDVPVDFPDDVFFEGPDLFQEIDEESQLIAGAKI